MRHKNLRLGSITLLFTVVVLCVAALSALTAATAHADSAVAGRYAAQVGSYYETERAGQEWLSAVDAALAREGADITENALPAGTTLADGKITAQLDAGNGRRLVAVLDITEKADGRYTIDTWQNTAEWQEENDLGGLFTGELPG